MRSTEFWNQRDGGKRPGHLGMGAVPQGGWLGRAS